MVFILLSTLLVHYKTNGRRQKISSFGEILYFWTEYALTIITMQGESYRAASMVTRDFYFV